LAGGDYRAGDGGDAGQGLAPKSQRGDGVQLFLAIDFAGGVTLEGDGDFFCGDAVAIVGYADLLDATFPQLYLQQLLGLPRPAYLHLPVAVTAAGKKLSKQTHARPIDDSPPGEALGRALTFLGHPPPEDLHGAAPGELLDWAINHWQPARLPCSKTITTDTD